MVQPNEPRPTRSFTARLAVDTLDVLQRIANEDDRSLAYIVQKAIDSYAETHGKRKGRKPKDTDEAF